jgi:hypothetical protein
VLDCVSNRGDAVSYYLISPAISNGLSFNKKTGTISGAPIVGEIVIVKQLDSNIATLFA